jgi:hypothetical protein
MKKISLCLAAIVIALWVAPAGAQRMADVEDPEIVKARAYTMDFYRGELARLHESFSPKFKDSMNLDQLRRFRRQVTLQYGIEKELIGEKVVTQDAFRIYIRQTRFDKHDGVVELLVALRPNYSIAGFSLRPAEDDGGS